MRGAKPLRALETAIAEQVGARPGEVLAAAVSGGPDSAALAGLLQRHAGEREARLVLLHVNHAVRVSADRDEGVVLAVGAALGARVLSRRLEPGPAGEARLRTLRYAALAEMARAAGAGRIFTAHHAGDQTETVLLALFRGTGPAGLRGIPRRRRLAAGMTLERPLLDVSKGDLVRYAAQRLLPYAFDPSNADHTLRRNAVRAALAGLRDEFPGLDEAVARCAALLADERERPGRAALRRRLREEVDSAAGDLRNVTFERIEALARAVEAGRPGRHHLRKGLEVTVRAR